MLIFVATSEGFYSSMENRYIYQYKDHLGNTRVSFAKNSEGVLEVSQNKEATGYNSGWSFYGEHIFRLYIFHGYYGRFPYRTDIKY